MDQAQNLRNIIKSERTVQTLSRVITVTSGKGGVGKSSLTVNLAISLSRTGKRVVILDADFGLANVEVMLGIRPKYSLFDLMFNGKSILDIVTKGPEGIGFISAGSGIREIANLTKDQFTNLSRHLVELDKNYDIIIIDTGAGISEGVMEFIVASAEVLLVVTPEPTSITDAYALIKTLGQNPEFTKEHCNIKLVTNRVKSEDMGQELFNKLRLVIDKFLSISLEHMGSIPDDAYMGRAVMKQQPLSIAFPNSYAAKAIEKIAIKLVQPTCELEIQHKKRGLAALFSGVLKRKIEKIKRKV